jgi:hypothetical protein
MRGTAPELLFGSLALMQLLLYCSRAGGVVTNGRLLPALSA